MLTKRTFVAIALSLTAGCTPAMPPDWHRTSMVMSVHVGAGLRPSPKVIECPAAKFV